MKSLRLARNHLVTVIEQADAAIDSSSAKLIEGTITKLEKAFYDLQSLLSGLQDSPDNETTIRAFVELEQRFKETSMRLMRAMPTAADKSSEITDTKLILQQQTQIMERMMQAQTIKAEKERSSFRLPQIDIPKFSGKQHEWTTFFDFFRTTIDENDTISDIQKFQYLRSAVSGEAEALISAILISAVNYKVAWKHLTDRYNRSYAVVRSILTQFLSCKPVSADLSNFAKVSNNVTTTFDMLDARGGYATSRDPWLIYLTLEKLDDESKQLWSRISVANDEPTLDEFIKFLNDRRSEIELHRGQSTNLSNAHKSGEKKLNIRVNSATPLKCIFCRKEHTISQCNEFRTSSQAVKEKFIKDSSRCFNCLGKGHNLKECRSTRNCSVCNSRHHTLLHLSNNPSVSDSSITTSPPSSNQQSVGHDSPVLQVNSVTPQPGSILPTVVLTVLDNFGNHVAVRALLDSGSQSVFVSESLVQRLNVKRERCRIPISRLGEDSRIYTKGTVWLNLFSRLNNDDHFHVNAYILTKVIEKCPSHDLSIKNLSYFESKFSLADPTFHISSDIDLILNSSFFFDILRTERYLCESDGLFLQNTLLGYVICSTETRPSSELISNCAIAQNPDYTNHLLERFWSSEEIPSCRPQLTESESSCESFFAKTVSRLPSGRFSVRLPFLSSPPSFLNSLSYAITRFRSLERKFVNNPELRTAYTSFMSEYEALGHMTKLPQTITNPLPANSFVIPHHGIFQHEGKLRVAFDGSARDSSGISLNDTLHSGPPLQLPINDVISRFRLGRYALTCDISKMYRQIMIDLDDRNYQLILWRPDSNLPLNLYQLNTVTYGLKCSPFLALRVLDELSSLAGSKFKLASEILKNNRYVDDILFSDNSLIQIARMRDELIELLSCACLDLRKWATNERTLLLSFPKDHVQDGIQIIDSSDQLVKTLGICWLPSEDNFAFQFKCEPLASYSKRQLVSDCAKLYDPMGWITPIVLKFKILIQEAWMLKIEWDSELPAHLKNEWVLLRNELKDIQSARIPRYLGDNILEIHGFSDASKAAYAAVIYTKSISEDGNVIVRLLTAKSKLAPIKSISIPRLELCAAHLLARLVSTSTSQFGLVHSRVFLWTDSKVTLAWINSVPRRWTSFVANRVSHIQELCPNAVWKYVTTKNNPADIPSRGMPPRALLENSMWWHGPSFLYTIDQTVSDPSPVITTSEESAKRSFVTIAQPEFWTHTTERFSNFNRLVRACAYVLRVRAILMHERACGGDPLTAEEIKFSLSFLIRRVQSVYFTAELSSLQADKTVKPDSSIRSLTPFLDNEMIIRARSRLTAVSSDIINSTPIIMPRCHFTEIIVRKVHIDSLHAGPTCMMSILRQTYWIQGSMKLVKKVYRSCQRCIRYNAVTFSPSMGSLPDFRQRDTKPFAFTGIDFAGPLPIKPSHGRGNVVLKGYIAIFVCLSTRAVHLELIMSLSVTSLVMGLRRFLARRGSVQVIWSDNGKNFVGCANALTEFSNNVQKNLTDDQFHSFLSSNFINWKFIPPYSPHFGGIWESGIRSVKRHLARGFSSSLFTIEELQTALAQIEEILNSRPLSPISLTDAEVPITPMHLLTGSSCSRFPTEFITHDSPLIKQRQASVATAVRHFWSHWRSDYLSSIMKRPKWLTSSSNPVLGDLVLIKRKNDPPRSWEYGKVIKAMPGGDNIVRVVELSTRRGVRTESVRNLIPLNVQSNISTGGEYGNG